MTMEREKHSGVKNSTAGILGAAYNIFTSSSGYFYFLLDFICVMMMIHGDVNFN